MRPRPTDYIYRYAAVVLSAVALVLLLRHAVVLAEVLCVASVVASAVAKYRTPAPRKED